MKIILLSMGIFLIIGLIVFSVQQKNSNMKNVLNEEKNMISNTKTTKQYNNLSAAEFTELIKKEEVIVVDVRTEAEYNRGHIKNSKLIPIDKFDKTMDGDPLPKDKKILVYCQSGNRSRTAASSLIVRGYSEVFNLKGGILSWETSGQPLEK